MGYSRKNPNRWLRTQNSKGQIKKKWNFLGCSRKNNVEFPQVLVFDLGISKGCLTILQNFQAWKLVFCRISKGKVTNLIIPGGSNVYPQPPLSGFFSEKPNMSNSLTYQLNIKCALVKCEIREHLQKPKFLQILAVKGVEGFGWIC